MTQNGIQMVGMDEHDDIPGLGDNVPVKNAAPGFVTLYDRIVIQRDPEVAAAAPGSVIVVPPAWRQKTVTGKILSGGMGALDMMKAHGIRIGDRVCWAKYAGALGQESSVRTDVPFPYKTTDVCLLMVKDILLDYSLEERLAFGEQEIVIGSDGRHCIVDVDPVGYPRAAAEYAEVQKALFPEHKE